MSRFEDLARLKELEETASGGGGDGEMKCDRRVGQTCVFLHCICSFAAANAEEDCPNFWKIKIEGSMEHDA